MNWRTSIATLVALLGLWAATGVYTIKPNERGVYLLMGRMVSDSVAPGLHWRPPYPLSRLIKVKALETKRVGVGALLVENVTGTAGPTGRNEFITGDNNLVSLELVVQYNIKEPAQYLFSALDVDRLITALAEAAATRAISDMGVNEVFYENKVRFQERVRTALRDQLDALKAGVLVGSVNLQKVRPAPEVAQEFNDVITAKADAQRSINEANSYSSDLIPRARGEATTIVEAAKGAAVDIVKTATGEADRFRSIYEEYRNAAALTRLRLYTEAMEKVLAKTRKVLV
ncbi:MAG: FtsH protease activity modulator HflK, partial [Candidatus Sumerlaeota bacterium]|nr:FtsH protease activity modulator HflK [Candidatus Sumerlaeota bacterium]